MPWNVITIRNHELYTNERVEFLTLSDGFVDSWDGDYIPSNVLVTNTTTNTTTSNRQQDDDVYDVSLTSTENHHHHHVGIGPLLSNK